ncbi:glycoside hydrolase family 73 protein [Neolewinella antarctica]|uniref:Mannosyl-glycoprotein endo-beta-N-acetylglucosamidase-like domain-containing protein n=1 Tax=Neolewinella antarctica TaxID=442734 RepID=A0ABX0X8B6_9BACT|nr:glucosaminidase domain-containing protein [Neolewinella antarctica]NJC25501.1 hypothetical protein [Neolewinella antarctica]
MFSFTTPNSMATSRRIITLRKFVFQYAFELLLVAFIIYMCAARGISFSVDLYDPITTEDYRERTGMGWNTESLFTSTSQSAASLFALLPSILPQAAPASTVAVARTVAIDAKHEGFNDVAPTDDPAPHISNLTLVLSPDYGERKGLPKHVIAAKRARVQNYLARFAPAARAEMRQHGIPASITLAQGLLESNAGDSRLARESSNHFGIKCRAKCLGCTCRNYGDDTRYDMFRVFTSAAESFQEHSKLLNSARYRKLKKHGNDYVKWAHGLKSCGYATDKKYGHKLVTIIENLNLEKYDTGL